MAWDIDTVRRAISDTESERTTLNQKMKEYERAWQMDFWSAEEMRLATQKKWRLYVSPEPRNVVSLMQSLLRGKLKIVCPAYEEDEASVMNATLRARFLEILIENQSHLRDSTLIDDLTWFGAVRGRMVLQVAWIWNELSEERRKFMPPILYRSLDPMACGFHRDAFGTQYAFHKYRESLETAKAKYPTLFKEKTLEGVTPSQKPDNTVTSKKDVEKVDFWYVEKEVVYYAVLIDNEFAQKPRKSQFPKIPIFERSNDAAPAGSERWRSGSVLEGMLGTWAEMNYLHSMHITAVGKKFFPAMFFSNDDGVAMPNIDLGPDAINDLPAGVRPLPGPDDRPDLGLLTSASERFDGEMQKATFPNALYGETGAQRAAYGAHMQMSMAARKAHPLKRQLEIILEEANEVALFMLKKFAPEEIEIYGYNPATQEGEQVNIGSDAIGERFDNKVSIDMVLPGTDLQEMSMFLQLHDAGLLSDGTTLRLVTPADKYIPDDEAYRVLEDKLMENEEILNDVMARVYKKMTGRSLPLPKEQGPPPGPPPGPPMNQGPMAQPYPGPMMGSPEMQGAVSPDMMGMNPNDPNTALQMEMMRNGGVPPSPLVQGQMLDGTFRRR